MQKLVNYFVYRGKYIKIYIVLKYFVSKGKEQRGLVCLQTRLRRLKRWEKPLGLSHFRLFSSVGRAEAWRALCPQFESGRSHQSRCPLLWAFWLLYQAKKLSSSRSEKDGVYDSDQMRFTQSLMPISSCSMGRSNNSFFVINCASTKSPYLKL